MRKRGVFEGVSLLLFQKPKNSCQSRQHFEMARISALSCLHSVPEWWDLRLLSNELGWERIGKGDTGHEVWPDPVHHVSDPSLEDGIYSNHK